MSVFYVGRLIQSISSDFSEFKIIQKIYNFDPRDYRCQYLNLDGIEYDYLCGNLQKWRNVSSGIKDIKIINSIKKFQNEFKINLLYTPTKIIYELIEDENGNFYGKEIITGLLFPLQNNKKTNYHYIKEGDYPELIEERICTDDNLARFKYIVTKDDVASINQLNKYKKVLTKKKKLDRFTEVITEIYNENVFKNEIIEKKEKVLEQQDELTKIMEDIEFLLMNLKVQNTELYDKHKAEYKSLINDDSTNTNYFEPSKENLLTLLSKIKLSILISKQKCDNVIDYLNNITEEYFTKMLTNQLSDKDLNINDLENFIEMFLKVKDNYNVNTQRSILKRLSLLYVFVVKSNIDKVNYSDLEKSYFKENIKTIILHISALYDIGLIKNNPNIDFNKDLSVETTLNIIKDIEFDKKKEEHIKKLVN